MFVRETKALIKDRLLIRNIFHPFIPCRRTFPIFGSDLSGFGRNFEDKDIHMVHTHNMHTITHARLWGEVLLSLKANCIYATIFHPKFLWMQYFLKETVCFNRTTFISPPTWSIKHLCVTDGCDQVRDGWAWDRLLSYPQNTNFMTPILAWSLLVKHR